MALSYQTIGDFLPRLEHIFGFFLVFVYLGNNAQLTQDAYSLVKSFQSDYIGNYASKEDFAEELAKMENELSDFALSYFDFSKYADDLFDTDFWYKDGYVFRNN